MEPSAMESIADRLSTVENLYFPGSINLPAPPSPPHLKALLLDLLSRDPSLFLERYGAHLTPTELLPFRSLPVPHSYELRFHLSRLSAPLPTSLPSPATVKNRRRAFMERALSAGDYFTEEAMREREPWMHYDMVGRFQDPAARGMPRPGERWSETLMRRWEEAEMAERIRGEQERLGVDRRDWVGCGGGKEEEEREVESQETETDDEEKDIEFEEEEDGPAMIKV